MTLLKHTIFLLLTLTCIVFEVESERSTKTKIQETSHQLQSIQEISTAVKETYLTRSSILYGLLKKLNESHVTDICNEHLQMLYNGINQKEIWAMKVLDSSAKFPSGFIFGNNFMLGSFKECESFKEFPKVTLSKRFVRNMKTNLVDTVGPFDVEYNVVHAKHDSPWQIQTNFFLFQKILQVGLCLPKSCTTDDVWNITQNYFDDETFGFASDYECQPEVLQVKTLNLDSNFLKKTSVQLIGAFIFITLLLSTISHAYQRDPENSSGNVRDSNEIKAKQKEASLLGSFLKCFSIKDNLNFILSTKSSPNSVPTINGLKSIACLLALLTHVGYYSVYSFDNPVTAVSEGEKPLFRFFSTVAFIVDVFFMISGLLLSYNFLKNQRNMSLIRQNTFWQNFKLFANQLFHRYLRITPFYLFVIGGLEISTAYLHETSPLWIEQRNDLTCQKYWWRHLLYIQNLYPVRETCMDWGWSLACEMQFFIFFTLLLFLYAKYPELAKKIFIYSFVAFTVIKYCVLHKNQFDFSGDVVLDLLDATYMPPYMRIIPYFIGIGTGWFLLNCKDTLNMDKKTTNYLFMVAASIIIACHYAAMNHGLSYEYASVIVIMIRIFYSGSVAWIIIASTRVNSVPIANLLNHKVFVHLNKLAYAVFVINGWVIILIYGLRDNSEHFSATNFLVMTIGIPIIVYILAFVCSLLFEVPYANLSSLLKNYKTKRL